MTKSLPHTLYRSDQVRDGERKIVDDLGISMYILMERAGMAVFQTLCQRWPDAQYILVCCGRGNNGGDGYVVARLALDAGLTVRLWSVFSPDVLSGDVLKAKQAYEDAGGIIHNDFDPDFLHDVVVDAIFGTGLNRPVTGVSADAINTLNAQVSPCLSIDIPSGLCANTGAVLGLAIKASITVGLIALKQGLFTGKAVDHIGQLLFNGLDISDEFEASIYPSATLLQASQARYLIPVRQHSAHKGVMGRLLCIGGQKGMGGAILLCGQAALRTGAGLVSLLTAEINMLSILSRQPELMTKSWMCSEGAEVLEHTLMWADTIVIGPGLGHSLWARQLFDGVLATNVPMVLDADALHFLSQYPRRYGNWVLTPHSGEAAKLLGISVNMVERDRFFAVKEIQNRYGGVVVLKGAGTIVYDGIDFTIICAGNAGMASGGMGDVLAGVIAAFISQTKHIGCAAILGAFQHSHAADIAVEQYGERGLIASDLLPLLGKNIE